MGAPNYLPPAIKKARQKPGGSNAGKYRGVPSNEFAGPAGGAPAGTFPIDTAKHARAAIALAHNAPNPAAIKNKARRKLQRIKAGLQGA